MVCWFSDMFDGSTAGTPGITVLSSSAPQRLRFFLDVRAGEEDKHSQLKHTWLKYKKQDRDDMGYVQGGGARLT